MADYTVSLRWRVDECTIDLLVEQSDYQFTQPKWGSSTIRNGEPAVAREAQRHQLLCAFEPSRQAVPGARLRGTSAVRCWAGLLNDGCLAGAPASTVEAVEDAKVH